MTPENPWNWRIFANGYLFSPQEMIDFVDSFQNNRVRVHFDTGNIMEYQFPEHWIPILGRRIRNVHLKEWDKRTHEFNLNTFRTLLDGTTNWPAVVEELDRVGYDGYLTFEYFHPFEHHPEALIYQTASASPVASCSLPSTAPDSARATRTSWRRLAG